MRRAKTVAIALFFLLGLFDSAGSAQGLSADRAGSAPIMEKALTAGGPSGSRSLYDKVFTIDIEALTFEPLALGVEFDGVDWWVTSAFDFVDTVIYRIDSSGTTLLSTYHTGHTGWGYRDMCFDGAYLYTSDSYYIEQIDPATGTATGVYYFTPITPARAEAYDPVSDSFWTATFGSDIYQVFRNGSYNSFPSIVATAYGMAWDDRNPAEPLIWIWSQDGMGCQCTAFDPMTGTFTGETWSGDSAAGIAGGATMFEDPTHGWIFAGLHQGAPDVICGYDMNLDPEPQVDVKVNGEDSGVSVLLGDSTVIDIDVEARGAAGIPFDVLVVIKPSFSGYFSHNGTGFQPNLGCAYFTGPLADMSATVLDAVIPYQGSYVVYLALDGNADGAASPGAVITYDECDFVITDQMHGTYFYDDGSTEDLLSLPGGGDICWMHRFSAFPGGETIINVQTIFGSPLFPGIAPGNGTPCEVFVWDDPTDDGDPADCVLLIREPTTVQNVDTDIVNVIPLSTPVVVSGEFYAGCVMTHGPYQYCCPMDKTTPYVAGDAFYCGSDTPGGFDPNNLMNNDHTPVEWGRYWTVRAGY